jgi:hypothetical protein
MARRSKSEWQEKRSEQEEKTDQELKESDDIKGEGETASRDFSDQPEPSLSDTADELNAISEGLKDDIRREHGAQAEVVDSSIEGQKQEVSEPLREVAQTEGQAAESLDASSSTTGRFEGRLCEAAEQRRDAESFANETAEEDEEHQDTSKDTVEDHKRAVEEAIRNIKEF